ncbi:MAG: hypothetical protein ACM3L6_02925 [Deltaproteobacteria bacterium]
MPREKRADTDLFERWMAEARSCHRTNLLADLVRRKDTCFDLLTRLYLEKPEGFSLFRKRLSAYLRRHRGAEYLFASAGYAAYLGSSFPAACRWFLKAVQENPENLDNWMDLAFALRHAGAEEMSNGILFHFDYLIHYVRLLGFPSGGLKGLRSFVRTISRAAEAGAGKPLR